MGYQIIFSENFPKRLFKLLASVQIVLVAIYVFFIIIGKHSRLFSLDGEGNVPAWFSSIQLFLVGIILLSGNIVYPMMRKITRSFIILLGLGFIFLSADEAGTIHETIGSFFRDTEMIPKDRARIVVWGSIYSVIAIAFLYWGWGAVTELNRKFRRELKLAAAGSALFIFGGVVLEALMHLFDLHNGPNQVLYRAEVALEEYCEMLGVSIIVFAVAKLLVRCQQEQLPRFDYNKNTVYEEDTLQINA